MFTADSALIQIRQLEQFSNLSPLQTVCLAGHEGGSLYWLAPPPNLWTWEQAGANKRMRQKYICKTGNNHWSRVKLLWLSIHVEHTESKNDRRRRHVRLMSHGSAWQANEPGSQREGQTTTRGSLCCPTYPEVLLLCSNPHPITLSTWRRSLIIAE